MDEPVSAEPASFASLPPELLLDIFAFAAADDAPSLRTLSACARLDRRCAELVQPLLLARPRLTSLERLEGFLAAVAASDGGTRGTCVTRLRVEGKVFASRGYGHGLFRALKACPRVRRLEVIGIDDLRPKYLVGTGGALPMASA